jgi:hypothetical protein
VAGPSRVATLSGGGVGGAVGAWGPSPLAGAAEVSGHARPFPPASEAAGRVRAGSGDGCSGSPRAAGSGAAIPSGGRGGGSGAVGSSVAIPSGGLRGSAVAGYKMERHVCDFSVILKSNSCDEICDFCVKPSL